MLLFLGLAICDLIINIQVFLAHHIVVTPKRLQHSPIIPILVHYNRLGESICLFLRRLLSAQLHIEHGVVVVVVLAFCCLGIVQIPCEKRIFTVTRNARVLSCMKLACLWWLILLLNCASCSILECYGTITSGCLLERSILCILNRVSLESTRLRVELRAQLFDPFIWIGFRWDLITVHIGVQETYLVNLGRVLHRLCSIVDLADLSRTIYQSILCWSSAYLLWDSSTDCWASSFLVLLWYVPIGT